MLAHYWALTYCPKITYAEKLKIISDNHCYEAYLSGDKSELATLLNTNRPSINRIFELTEECLTVLKIDDWLSLINSGECRYINYFDSDYPVMFKNIQDPPLGFWFKGSVNALKLKHIAVVGSRKATPYGVQQCRQFCTAMLDAGLSIISGLAYGIDTCAHQSCVDKAMPTLAVLGSGIQRIYPNKNQNLSERILQCGGALLSEYQPYDPPFHWHFPERNRLIAALSEAVLIVEAALKSGSLITANHAANQGKDVFAIPGAINKAQSAGCHQLIKDGAHLADSPNEVLGYLGLSALEMNPLQPNLDLPVMRLLAEGPLHIDKIVQLSGLTLGEVSSMLSLLEFEGLVLRYDNGLYYLR